MSLHGILFMTKGAEQKILGTTVPAASFGLADPTCDPSSTGTNRFKEDL